MKRYIQAAPDSLTSSGLKHIYTNRVQGAIIKLRLRDAIWSIEGTKFTIHRDDGALIVITCATRKARIRKEGSDDKIDVEITTDARLDIKNIANAILNI